MADKPALLDPAGQPFSHVKRLLLRVERCHAGQHPPLHPTGRGVFGRLRNGNELQAVFGFQPLQFNVVEEVAGRPVHLVEQQAGQFVRVLLGVGEQFLEGPPLVLLGGGLRNAEQLDDDAAHALGIAPQGILLNVEGKPFPLLFAGTHAGQGNVFLRHGLLLRSTSNRLLTFNMMLRPS